MAHTLLLIGLQYRIRATLFSSCIATALVMIGVFTRSAVADGVVGCFERAYDNAHLSRHPDQVVKAVKLFIKKTSPDSYYRYDFALRLMLRGTNEPLQTGGYCYNEGSGVKCQVECDGGGVYVVPHAGYVVMFLDRIRTARCGKDYVKGGEDVSGGKDDREFRLNQTTSVRCIDNRTVERGARCSVDDPTGTLLNVRASPNGSILGALHNGTIGDIRDVAFDRGGGPWAYIVPVGQGKPGWVYRAYLSCQ